jgi:hypothetical protein
MSDSDKIRLQLFLDVTEYRRCVDSLLLAVGLNVSQGVAQKELTELSAMVQGWNKPQSITSPQS